MPSKRSAKGPTGPRRAWIPCDVNRKEIPVGTEHLCVSRTRCQKKHPNRRAVPRGQPLFRGEYSLAVQPACQCEPAGTMQYRFSTTISEAAPSTNEQTMVFSDASQAYSYAVDSTPDPTFNVGNYGNSDLGEFLSRPVRILSKSWGLNGNLNETFDPWTLFFTNPAVLNRLQNYALLRCKLKLKVVINATKFHYGRAILSYDPWSGYDQVSPVFIGSQDEIMFYSQRPHVYINPTNSEGGELVLPFFHLENWIDVTSAEAFSEMGFAKLTSFDVLKHASAGSSDVTVTIFAWAEDVELCVPTASAAMQALAAPREVFPQSKKSKRTSTSDEYSGTGAISGPASAIAAAAGELEKIPIIKPFAMATRIAVGAVAGVAKIFGFSRPAVLDTTQYYKPRFASNLAATDQPETVEKLTIDSKQEITVDPRTVGLAGQDELMLDYITSKETYLTSFAWLPTYPIDRLMFTSHVAPMLELQKSSGAGGDLFYPTALSFATWPFLNWSGSIIFRFQVVCSGFHQGRLRVSYNPVGNGQNTATAFNTVYNRIVDISDEDDFELEVAWADWAPYKRTNWNKQDVHWLAGQGGQAIVSNPLFDNGLITVRVLNELTAPSDTADINVNVFVRAGDDFELINPTEVNLLNASYLPELLGLRSDQTVEAREALPQSADDDATNILEASDPSPEGIGSTPMFGAANPSMADQKKQVFFGETIKSFRTLLRRYNHYRAWPIIVSTPVPATLPLYGVAYVNTPAMSKTKGYDISGLDQTAGAPFNYVNLTLLQYLMPAYAGWRGSLRSKWREISRRGSHLDIVRGYIETGDLPNTTGFYTYNGAGTASQIAFSGILGRSCMTGSVMTPTENQPYMEVEYPFQTGKRFAFARNVRDKLSTRDETRQVCNRVEVKFEKDEDNIDIILDEYQSVGEDFSLFFFVNAPPRHEYAVPSHA